MIRAIDHVVLTVRSIDDTLAFYEQLGIGAITFGEDRKALAIGHQKINLHELGREVMPNARAAMPGTGDMCLLTDEPMDALVVRLSGRGIPIEHGPVPQQGARSRLLSIYLRDPDGNLVELANEVPG